MSNTADLKAGLQSVDPYKFEKLVAELWGKFGFETTVKSKSNDRGIDIIAEKTEPIKQTHLIQAKRYTSGNKVGSEEVRKYATLYQQSDDADFVVIVTTSGFTTEAQRLADDLDVSTVGGDKLVNLISDTIPDVGEFDKRTEQGEMDKIQEGSQPKREFEDFDEIDNEFVDEIAHLYNSFYIDQIVSEKAFVDNINSIVKKIESPTEPDIMVLKDLYERGAFENSNVDSNEVEYLLKGHLDKFSE